MLSSDFLSHPVCLHYVELCSFIDGLSPDVGVTNMRWLTALYKSIIIIIVVTF